MPGENTSHSKHPIPKTWGNATHGQHQMLKTEIRLITLFVAKDGEALYGQQK